MIASRTKSKCDDLKAKLGGAKQVQGETAALDADKVEKLIALRSKATSQKLFRQ